MSGRIEDRNMPAKAGYEVQESNVQGDNLQGERVTENIYLCPDGKYRWAYEYHMLSNPTILITVWKVLALSFGIVMLFTLLVSLGDIMRYGWEDFSGFFGGMLLLLLFLMALGVVAYIIVAAVYGWKYMVLFEMDENRVVHTQMQKQVKRSEAIGLLTALVGAASGNLTTMGIGMISSARTTSISSFEKVKKVKGSRMFHTIKVNELLEHNQVYAEEPDYDFVYNWIATHCPNAKIR